MLKNKLGILPIISIVFFSIGIGLGLNSVSNIFFSEHIKQGYYIELFISFLILILAFFLMKGYRWVKNFISIILILVIFLFAFGLIYEPFVNRSSTRYLLSNIGGYIAVVGVCTTLVLLLNNEKATLNNGNEEEYDDILDA